MGNGHNDQAARDLYFQAMKPGSYLGKSPAIDYLNSIQRLPAVQYGKRQELSDLARESYCSNSQKGRDLYELEEKKY